MKTRVALLALALAFTTLSVRAADPVIDALVAQIQSNPSSATTAAVQAAAANPAIASDIFKAAFDAAPDQITETVKAAVASAPEVAVTAFQVALKTLTVGLDKKDAAEKARELYKAAADAIPSGTEASLRKKLLKAFEQSTRSSSRDQRPDFPHQRPPVVVSPSR